MTPSIEFTGRLDTLLGETYAFGFSTWGSDQQSFWDELKAKHVICGYQLVNVPRIRVRDEAPFSAMIDLNGSHQETVRIFKQIAVQKDKEVYHVLLHPVLFYYDQECWLLELGREDFPTCRWRLVYGHSSEVRFILVDGQRRLIPDQGYATKDDAYLALRKSLLIDE